MTAVSVVIVNYRSGELLQSCLTSLFQNTCSPNLEIFVVNNDLSRDLAPLRSSEWPRVQFIQNSSNLGFAAAANVGFHHSRHEFILLLNPDVVVHAGAIEVLANTLSQHPEAGIALPRLLNPDGSLQYSCRRFYTYKTLLLRRAPWNRLFRDHPAVRNHLMSDWNHQGLAQVDWGLGAAMMVRRSALSEPDLFDDRFFLYFEDVDLCLRMRRQGWKVIYNSTATMIHQHRRDSAHHLFNPAKRHHFLSLIRYLWKYQFRLEGKEY